jgi:hypothetical protein
MSEPKAAPPVTSAAPPGGGEQPVRPTVSVSHGPDPEGHDAVCFTAGPQAAVVGAGVIHAYLAARRRAPRAVAGISLGSLNAAAMQRVYRDLAAVRGALPPVEQAARRAWFRAVAHRQGDRPARQPRGRAPGLPDQRGGRAPARRALRYDEVLPGTIVVALAPT